MKRYTEEHEWVDLRGDVAIVGITAHAARELGDITFVELPELNAQFAQGDVISVVESVKAASDVYSPVSGTVCDVNAALENSPEQLNISPEDKAWICKLKNVKKDEIDGLMLEEDYIDFIS